MSGCQPNPNRRSPGPTSPDSPWPSPAGGIPTVPGWPCPTRRRRRRCGRRARRCVRSTPSTATGGSPLVGAAWPRWAPLPASRWLCSTAPPWSGRAPRRGWWDCRPTRRSLEAGVALVAAGEVVACSAGDVVARSLERLGAIVLTERPLAAPPRALVTEALLSGLRVEGLGLLSWSRDARELRQRLAFCYRVFSTPWPDVGDDTLLAGAVRWLGPELARAAGRDDLRRIDVVVALRRLLPL